MRAPRNWNVFIVVALLLALSPAVLAEQSRGTAPGDDLIVLADAARHFGADVSWRPAEGKLLLSYKDSQAQVLIGSDRMLVDNRPLILSAPVRIKQGEVCVLSEDAAAILSSLLHREISQSEITSAGVGWGADALQRQDLLLDSVRYITYPLFTRFIITLTGIADIETAQVRFDEGDKNLSLILSDCRLAHPEPPVEINDGRVGKLETIQAGQDVRLSIEMRVKKMTYEMQKYNEPPRIILDVRPDEPVPVIPFQQQTALPPANGWTEIEPAAPSEQARLTTVVIDPGHGGKDVGASGKSGLLEKDVTLDIALRLKQLIEKNPGIKVVLTRNADYFVSLEERTVIANRAKDGAPADLFISIHTNSHRSAKVNGFETYYISDAVDPGAEATAALENAVVNLERQGGTETADSLAPILWDLQFTEFIAESSELAFIAEKELSERLDTRDRGVRQAKFIVLAGVAMPSILIEIGFISNRVEESRMNTADFKDKCAEALAKTVLSFKERRDVRLGRLDGETGPR